MPSCLPASGAPFCRRDAMPTAWNAPSVKFGPAWQDAQLPLPMKIRRPRCAEVRIARRGLRIAARERVPKLVEGRTTAFERLLIRGERLADADEHRLVVRGRGAERGGECAPQLGVVAHQRGDALRARTHLARVEQRPDALRPERVVRAVPAEPAVKADVHHGRRVAVHGLEAERPRAAVGEAAPRLVAGRAEDPAAPRQPRAEEQPLTERDRLGLARPAVGRVARRRLRPRSVREDAGSFSGRERDRVAGASGAEGEHRQAGEDPHREPDGVDVFGKRESSTSGRAPSPIRSRAFTRLTLLYGMPTLHAREWQHKWRCSSGWQDSAFAPGEARNRRLVRDLTRGGRTVQGG